MKHKMSEREQSARAMSKRLDAIGMSCLLAAWGVLFVPTLPGVSAFLAGNTILGRDLIGWTSHLFALWNVCGWALLARRRR